MAIRKTAAHPLATVLLLLILMVPSPGAGVSTSQQELEAVKHSTPSLVHGEQIFHSCAGCHGPDGGGTRDGLVPRIAGQHASVLGRQLLDYRYDRRWDPRMERVADRHDLPTAQAIADVTAYISGLETEFATGTGDGMLVQQGAASYSHMCRGCHGVAAQGDAAHAIPRLAGQHYQYLLRQIYDAVDGRRPNFSPAHVRLLARLDYDGIQAVADYLSRLGGPPTRAPSAPEAATAGGQSAPPPLPPPGAGRVAR